MRRIMTLAIAVATLVLALGATSALAQIDVNMAFDPTEASAGDQVSFFVSVANLGDAAVVADLEITVSFGTFTFGPIGGMLPLAAGQELSHEIVLFVPPLPTGGDLTISLTATADGFSDSATATLTVLPGTSGSAEAGIAGIATAIQRAFSTSTPTDAPSVGELKARY